MCRYEMALGSRAASWWAASGRLRPQPLGLGGVNTQTVHVQLPADVDGHCARARAAGAVIAAEPDDQFYGDRTYRAIDPEGHAWSFAVHMRNVTRAEAEATIGQPITATNWG